MYSQNENPWQNQNAPDRYPTRPPKSPKNKMVTASLVCALLAIVSICTVYGPFIFGGLAIILALLSRGNEKKLVRAAKGNLILSLVAIGISLIIIISTVLYIVSTFDSFGSFYQYYIQTMENTYGLTDEQLKQYGIDPNMFGSNGADETIEPEIEVPSQIITDAPAGDML